MQTFVIARETKIEAAIARASRGLSVQHAGFASNEAHATHTPHFLKDLPAANGSRRESYLISDEETLPRLKRDLNLGPLYSAIKLSDMLIDYAVTGVKRVEILAPVYSEERCALALDIPEGGPLRLTTLLDAIWAGTILSMDATIEAGNGNGACLDPCCADHARRLAEQLGAETDPAENSYTPGNPFLEGFEGSFDEATGTFKLLPIIGS